MALFQTHVSEHPLEKKSTVLSRSKMLFTIHLPKDSLVLMLNFWDCGWLLWKPASHNIFSCLSRSLENVLTAICPFSNPYWSISYIYRQVLKIKTKPGYCGKIKAETTNVYWMYFSLSKCQCFIFHLFAVCFYILPIESPLKCQPPGACLVEFYFILFWTFRQFLAFTAYSYSLQLYNIPQYSIFARGY